MRINHLGLLLLCIPMAAAVAADNSGSKKASVDDESTPVVAEKTPADPLLNPDLLDAGILQNYPDLMFREWGLNAMRDKRYERAMAYFKRASYYADKPAQAMLAEMYWKGQGAPQDRALAYAWADLAAERGYIMFVVQREKFWEAMTEAERSRAVEEGQIIYAQFGDEAAKPRYASRLRWKQKEATGSRLGGFAGASTKIQLPGLNEEDAGNTIDASKFYDPQNFDVDRHWARTDKVWAKMRNPTVTVGDVEQANDAAGTKSRVPETKPQQDVPEPPIPEGDAP